MGAGAGVCALIGWPRPGEAWDGYGVGGKARLSGFGFVGAGAEPRRTDWGILPPDVAGLGVMSMASESALLSGKGAGVVAVAASAAPSTDGGEFDPDKVASRLARLHKARPVGEGMDDEQRAVARVEAWARGGDLDKAIRRCTTVQAFCRRIGAYTAADRWQEREAELREQQAALASKRARAMAQAASADLLGSIILQIAARQASKAARAVRFGRRPRGEYDAQAAAAAFDWRKSRERVVSLESEREGAQAAAAAVWVYLSSFSARHPRIMGGRGWECWAGRGRWSRFCRLVAWRAASSSFDDGGKAGFVGRDRLPVHQAQAGRSAFGLVNACVPLDGAARALGIADDDDDDDDASGGGLTRQAFAATVAKWEQSERVNVPRRLSRRLAVAWISATLRGKGDKCGRFFAWIICGASWERAARACGWSAEWASEQCRKGKWLDTLAGAAADYSSPEVRRKRRQLRALGVSVSRVVRDMRALKVGKVLALRRGALVTSGRLVSEARKFRAGDRFSVRRVGVVRQVPVAGQVRRVVVPLSAGQWRRLADRRGVLVERARALRAWLTAEADGRAAAFKACKAGLSSGKLR